MAESVHILEPSITYTSTADTIRFAGGQRIVSLPSGNPPALRGYTADVIIIDESAYIERPADVFAAIAPTLTRNPDAELVLASTPAGKASWFYDKVQEAKSNPKDWYFQQTTIEDAVAEGLDIDLEGLRKTISDPDTWDREFMCKFAADFSSLIDTNLLEFCEPSEAVIGRWMGMDVGSTSDRTAVVTLAELADHTLYVEDIVMLYKASYEHQLEVLRQLHAKNAYLAGYIDANGIGSALSEFANKQVSARLRGFTWTGSNKTPAYEALRARCFDHKLKFAPHLKELIVSDFGNVHRIVSEAGRVTYEAGRNSDGHSDATSALVLAIQAAAGSPCTIALPVTHSYSSPFGPRVSRLI